MKGVICFAIVLLLLACTSATPTPISVPELNNLDEAAPAAAVGVRQGSAAPSFQLNTLDGSSVSLRDFRGQPVVINFWATWCLPCREEMPELIDAYQRHSDDGLVVLAIDATLQDTLEDVAKFVEEFELPFAVLLDEEGKVNQDYRVLGLPTSFFIDADGVIQAVNAGPMSDELIAGYLEQILPK